MTLATYNRLWELKLRPEELETFRFPRAHPDDPTRAILKTYQESQEPETEELSLLSRKCTRCDAVFEVDHEGKAKMQTCRYHPFKTMYTKKYRCCGRKSTGKPCKQAKQHVHNHLPPGALENFRQTKYNPNPAKTVYSLKCGRVYTDKGMEVACVSLVDSFCTSIYERIVKPEGNILDYMTEFSGLEKRHLINEQITLDQIISDLNVLIGPNTILVGFWLQRDLVSLRMLHENIIEITALYPHKLGPEYKNSLYYLRKTYISGEDIRAPLKVTEEANTAMKLAMYMI